MPLIPGYDTLKYKHDIVPILYQTVTAFKETFLKREVAKE